MATEVETPDENQDEAPPPIELLEKAAADMLDGRNVGPAFWDRTLGEFRKALDAARRENIWDVVDLAFGHIVAVSTEMLVRSQIALRMRMERLEQRKGARQFPNVGEDAERVARTARFLLETAVQYGKVRHLSSLVRRQGDPKIVDFEEAREKVIREKAEAGDAEKKVEVAEA